MRLAVEWHVCQLYRLIRLSAGVTVDANAWERSRAEVGFKDLVLKAFCKKNCFRRLNYPTIVLNEII